MEADGNATEDTFAKALGCNDFYIPENWEELGWAPGFDSVYNDRLFGYTGFYAARDIDTSGKEDSSRLKNLDKAKEYVIKGNNSVYKGKLAETKADKRKYYSKAITNYCKAQCYAQAAQDNPEKVLRDGRDY